MTAPTTTANRTTLPVADRVDRINWPAVTDALDDVARQLDEYFSGRRRHFDVPVDLQLVHGFRFAVISHLRDIDYGSTESYATVAKAAGSPAAVRAVWWALRSGGCSVPWSPSTWVTLSSTRICGLMSTPRSLASAPPR